MTDKCIGEVYECYRVWANGSAVLVDAYSASEARKIAKRFLECSDSEIDSVELLKPNTAESLERLD